MFVRRRCTSRVVSAACTRIVLHRRENHTRTQQRRARAVITCTQTTRFFFFFFSSADRTTAGPAGPARRSRGFLKRRYRLGKGRETNALPSSNKTLRRREMRNVCVCDLANRFDVFAATSSSINNNILFRRFRGKRGEGGQMIRPRLEIDSENIRFGKSD